MTTLEITLPDQLAQEAQQAGLLAPEHLENWLREQLKARRVQELFEAVDRMRAVDDPSPMTPEEVADEIQAVRAERRARTVACG